MHGHEGVVERVNNHLLAVIRHLNGRTLAEGGGVGEVRRSIIETDFRVARHSSAKSNTRRKGTIYSGLS